MAKKEAPPQAPPKKEAPKEPPKLTPHECAIAADHYEQAALRIQEMYTMGAPVSEAVKRALAIANMIRSGRHQ